MISSVTSLTLRRYIRIIINVMTFLALALDVFMSSGKGIETTVYREFSRRPPGLGGVAHGTVLGNIECLVIGDGSGFKVGVVATYTGIGDNGIFRILMAQRTIVSDSSMSSGKGIEPIVYWEARGFPPRICRVARCTIQGNVKCFVIRGACLVVLIGVTGLAFGRRISIGSVVASITFLSDRSMSTC